jgi:hypothetical protein
LNNGKQKQPRKYTLFIATIALVAPFIPVEIEVLAYNAYKRNLEIMKNETQASPLENKEFFLAHLCVSCYTPDLCTTSLQIGYLLA